MVTSNEKLWAILQVRVFTRLPARGRAHGGRRDSANRAWIGAVLYHLATSAALLIQAPQPSPRDSSFFRDRDGTLALAAVGSTAALALFDERIARWTRRPAVQGDSSRRELIEVVTYVNEIPLTVGALATFGIGRLAGWRTVADVGLHLTESLLLTEAVAEVVRVAAGRTRPRESPDDAFEFKPGRGLTRFENRAFPSLHAAVAFATAASLAEEMRIREVESRRWATPLLYGAAMVPGLTRLYLDQHWATDVFAGSFLGAFLGSRVTRYAHGRRTKLDRTLLPAYFIPDADGVLIGWSISY